MSFVFSQSQVDQKASWVAALRAPFIVMGPPLPNTSPRTIMKLFGPSGILIVSSLPTTFASVGWKEQQCFPMKRLLRMIHPARRERFSAQCVGLRVVLPSPFGVSCLFRRYMQILVNLRHLTRWRVNWSCKKQGVTSWLCGSQLQRRPWLCGVWVSPNLCRSSLPSKNRPAQLVGSSPRFS